MIPTQLSKKLQQKIAPIQYLKFHQQKTEKMLSQSIQNLNQNDQGLAQSNQDHIPRDQDLVLGDLDLDQGDPDQEDLDVDQGDLDLDQGDLDLNQGDLNPIPRRPNLDPGDQDQKGPHQSLGNPRGQGQDQQP